MNVEIYRTDLHGTIIFTTDGTEINIAVEKNSAG
jgi:beta-lactamase superfamily II metal-dependent hydrolase